VPSSKSPRAPALPGGSPAPALQLGGPMKLGGDDAGASPKAGPSGERGALLQAIQLGKALKKVDKPVNKSVLFTQFLYFFLSNMLLLLVSASGCFESWEQESNN
jgi:hypothetical protein